MRLLRRAAVVFALLSAGFALSVLYVTGHCPAPVPAGPERFSDVPFAHALEHVDPRYGTDFGALQRDRAELDRYVASLATWSPLNRPEAFPEKEDVLAYWLNAYNALALQALVDRWPAVRSPHELLADHFYWALSWPVGGQRLTLWSIERRLRDEYADARVHFALACGARGCPLLDDSPYQGATLDAQLNDAGRRFMANPLQVKLTGKVLRLSPLFRWYQHDFLEALPEGGEASVLQVVWAFLPDACDERPGCETRADLDTSCGPRLDRCTVEYAEMDWSPVARAAP